MKKLIFIVVVLTTIGCTVSPQKNAQKLVKEYLKVNLDNWESYESVSFGNLDSLFSKISDDKEYLEITSKLLQWIQEYKYVEDYMNSKTTYYDKEDFHKGLRASDSINKYSPIYDSLESNFKPQHIGWKLPHTYRANNNIGAKVIHKDTFMIDIPFKKIINVLSN